MCLLCQRTPNLRDLEVRLVHLGKCGELVVLYQALWRMTYHLTVVRSTSPLDDAPPVGAPGGSGKSAGVRCVATSSVAFLSGSRGSCPRLGALLRSCAIVIRHSPGVCV